MTLKVVALAETLPRDFLETPESRSQNLNTEKFHR